jgi:hypothetical protein
MKKIAIASAAAFIGLGSAAIAQCKFCNPEAAPTSFWYQKIPHAATLHVNTANYQTEFTRQLTAPYATSVTANIRSYSPPVYVAQANTPTTNVNFYDCQHTGYPDAKLAADFQNVPMPSYARTGDGTDMDMAVYQPSTDTYWEFWVANKDVDGNWQACWGGKFTDFSKSDGTTGRYGQAAAGLPIAPAQIKIEELRRGQINHVIGIELVDLKQGTVWWPASRSDGVTNTTYAIPYGARFRVDPTLDLSTLGLNPWGLAVARAAQEYGFVAYDRTTGGIAIRYENPYRYEQEGWPTSIYTELRSQLGTSAGHELDNFPWDHLQFMPQDYGSPSYTTWTPADLGSNLTVWMDASTSGSIAQSGGAVSQWCDPRDTAGSCSRVNGTQSTAGKKPTISSNIVTFASASSQVLNLSSAITGASTFTCWATIKVPAYAEHAVLFGNSTSASAYPFNIYNGVINIASANGYATAGVWSDYSNYHTIMVSSNNASNNSGFDVWVDGEQRAIAGYASAARASTWDVVGLINGSIYGNVSVKEAFCSNADESATVDSNGRSYLKQKWGTP